MRLNDADSLYLGERAVDRVYLGAHPVWPASPGEDPDPPAEWLGTREWSLGTGTGTLASSAGDPAAERSALVACVAVKSAAMPDISVSDDLGGSWVMAGRAGVDASSVCAIFVNNDAQGVTSVSASLSDPSHSHLHVWELVGSSGGAVRGDGRVLPSGTSWEPVLVPAPVGAISVAMVSLGVTTRSIGVAEGFIKVSEHKQSGLHTLVALGLVAEEGDVGPTWVYESGGSASLVTVTAVIEP